MPYADNQGVRIHYEVEGNGPPLVLQHGFTDSLQTWYDLGYVEALKAGHRLILIDARGHGASDKPHEPKAYRSERNAANVVAVLQELEIPHAHFFGYSMGGWIAFDGAIRRREGARADNRRLKPKPSGSHRPDAPGPATTGTASPP